eukprot:CAMPEP_0181229560 /NCGR_PEP_ID=MMETSP1096-20121128/33967_1 /TAXON_ID=156174 ORGANISM="Chrysochromulina ericina, Strain CCMP281" /NCGR_SAMPLE_ID=MMETSP1096 /ASSEMBLY_ACC=CAM_ASM_000453 /LENGTH=208 /DNA_ID=CAMNT_0023323201 /DNA_START=680 /DNA_END=1307 /DNA_ORIENTATION=-
MGTGGKIRGGRGAGKGPPWRLRSDLAPKEDRDRPRAPNSLTSSHRRGVAAGRHEAYESGGRDPPEPITTPVASQLASLPETMLLFATQPYPIGVRWASPGRPEARATGETIGDVRLADVRRHQHPPAEDYCCRVHRPQQMRAQYNVNLGLVERISCSVCLPHALLRQAGIQNAERTLVVPDIVVCGLSMSHQQDTDSSLGLAGRLVRR